MKVYTDQNKDKNICGQNTVRGIRVIMKQLS